MYLSDVSIFQRCTLPRLGVSKIGITPFNSSRIQASGYDLSIAHQLTLEPGEFKLACTQERVELPADIAAQITGRSSIGRLGVIVHATAGHVDPGFQGQLTLEMFNLSQEARTFEPGDVIAQLLFVLLDGPAVYLYSGRYQNQEGATESRWEGLARQSM